MKKINWNMIAVFLIVLLLAFMVGTSLFGGWGYGGYGMMGWGNRGWGGHMGWGFTPFGWFGMGLGMLFMWLIPIGVIALVVYGVIALARNAGTPPPAAPLAPCPNCGRGAQGDWKNCPYCGTTLK